MTQTLGKTQAIFYFGKDRPFGLPIGFFFDMLFVFEAWNSETVFLAILGSGRERVTLGLQKELLIELAELLGIHLRNGRGLLLGVVIGGLLLLALDHVVV